MEQTPEIRIQSQPKTYQITNFNIHPAPCLLFPSLMDQDITVTAHLVQCDETKQLVSKGFQGGDIQILRSGQTRLVFKGLKLNKMNPIKMEMNYQIHKQTQFVFRIRFKVDNNFIFSDSFNLVSNCSQIPSDVRDTVRKRPYTAFYNQNNMFSPFQYEIKSPEEIVVETIYARTELENAIEDTDMETAGRAAQKLAYLRKIQLDQLSGFLIEQ